MSTTTTKYLLLVLACLCRVISYGQTSSTSLIAADRPNFTTFTPSVRSDAAAWKKFNAAAEQQHPEFGILPPGAPCTECVELLDKRTAEERVFRSYRNSNELYIQKALGELHYRKDGRWITIGDKLKPLAPGKYESDYYAEPAGIDAGAGKSYIKTPLGKVYFNQWNLYARTPQGDMLLDKADWSHYTAGDDGVYVHNIFKDIDAELRVYRGSVKTSFIMKKNSYGVFDQLIFRDEYDAGTATSISFADPAAQQTGMGKLEVFSGDKAVLSVKEAVIYPKDAAKNNVLTAAYALNGKYMDVLVPYTWIRDNIGQHELVIDPTVTGTSTLTTASITGSKYNASCSFDSSCNYTLSVNIPAATTVTGVSYSFTYLASAPCFGSDGGVRFSTGSCSTPVFTNQSQTPGPTIMNLVPITNDVQGCLPQPSCSAQSISFTMQFFRSCKGPQGCDNTCIGAAAPWVMTVKAKTVEFNDPVDPISYTSNNICVGDSIYVSTWATFGVPPYNYNWSFNPSGTPSLGTGASTSITFPNIVNNTIYAIITDACGHTAVDSLPITVNYAAVIATPSGDTLCSGETTAINLTTPSPGSTFDWTVVQTGVTGASAGSGNTIAQTLTTTGSAPGTAVYTITPHNGGCTGIPVTVPITVNPPVTIVKNTTICSSQLPYSWNGQTITGGGASVATYTTPSMLTGCDSTTILNLTVNPVLTAQQHITICAGQLPYTWNGQTITAGGNGVATFTTTALSNNCDSITTLNLTVVNTLSATVNLTLCASQLPYTWNGINVTAGGPAAAAYTSTSAVSGCDSVTTLSLTVNPLPATTVNVALCANQLPYTWNGQSITAGGPAVATYTAPSLLTGCDSTATLNLTVHPLITAVQNIAICSSQLPYAWNGQTITAGGTAVATYTAPSVLTGCDSTTTLNLTVNPVVNATKSMTICSSQLPYTWNGIVVTAGGSTAAAYTTPSLVTGCDSTTTLNLTVNPLPATIVNLTICSSQLPYSWNGQTLTAGGTPAAVYTTPSLLTGCDSTVTLNLTVNPVLAATVAHTICAGQLPYTWNGITVNTGGSNAATFTTTSLASGCDSITTLNLTVNPVQTATKNISICASQLPYTWNGQLIAAGGAAVASYTTPSLLTGCDSITTLNLTVNPLINVTKSISICASQLPYTWNGQTINAPGAAVAAFTTASLVTGCDSTTTLNLSVNPVLTATKNITICAGQLPYTWNGITVVAGGTAAATFTTSSLVTNCDSTTTLNLTVNPLLTAVKNLTICAGQLPYTWNGITVTTGGNGIAAYTTASSATGCDSTTTLNLTVIPALTDTVHMSICANQIPFTWNGINVISGGPSAAVYATTASNSCDSISVLHLTFKPVYAQTFDTTICATQTPFAWNGQSYSSSGTYTHNYSTMLGCDSTLTLVLHVGAPPVTLPVKDSSGCGHVVFNGQVYYNNAILKDTLYNSAGCDSAYLTTHIKVLHSTSDTLGAEICANESYTWNGDTYNRSGWYTKQYKTAAGCDSLLHLDLKVWPLPAVGIGYELTGTPCTDDTLRVAGNGAQTYAWKLNGQDMGEGAEGQMVLSATHNTIVVKGRDAHQCENSATISIETRPCCEMMIPNAFSPNGDGLNDKFGPETIGNPKEFKMMIFNRYGQLLFTSVDIHNRWDGTFNGRLVDMGTYYFRVYTRCTNDSESTYKGDVTLIR